MRVSRRRQKYSGFGGRKLLQMAVNSKETYVHLTVSAAAISRFELGPNLPQILHNICAGGGKNNVWGGTYILLRFKGLLPSLQ